MSASASPLDGVKGRQQRMWASGDDAAATTRLHPIVDEVGGDERGIGGRALTTEGGNGGRSGRLRRGDPMKRPPTWPASEGSRPVELNANFVARSGTKELLTPVARPKGCDV